MNIKNFLLLVLLASLWGASFLFIRVGVPAFGPIPLMAMRVTVAAVFLVIILMVKSNLPKMSLKMLVIFFVGVTNQALPFCLFAYAEITLPAGVTSVINATTPMWAAIIAFFWANDRLSITRIAGLFIGFSGILMLLWKDFIGLSTLSQNAVAPLAVLLATFLYGFSANFTKRFLAGIDSLTVATGSMIGAVIMLLPLAYIYWPTTSIPLSAWSSVIFLGIACTGIAYIIYFYLITTAGPARAVLVTFITPIFGILWSTLFLHEVITITILVGCVVVIIGTMLTSGGLNALALVRKHSIWDRSRK